MAVEAKDVVVIGGGFAGLSAGVALAERGFRVALLEGKPALGGRAYSFNDPETGDFVDNGQHVLMGCYHATLDFLRRIGARDRLIVQRKLLIEMLDGPGRRAYLRAAPLPGPLHMAGGVLGYAHLTIAERIGVLRAGLKLMAMRRREPARIARMSVAELMDAMGQGPRARAAFWYPISIATLNEDPGLASAGLLAEVMKRAFFARRGESAMIYSRVGLSDLYCTAAREFIEHRDGVVACRALVEAIEMGEDGTVAAVRLRDGSRLGAANFVAAVPAEQLMKLVPVPGDPAFASIGSIRSSPIICVHVWLDREVTNAAFVGFIGTTTQWLFNKRQIFARHGERHSGYLSFVISGARHLVDRTNDELLEIVTNDLRTMIPAARNANVVKAIVMKEKHATMAPDPLSDMSRPQTSTPIPNLFLAGDWIQTGLPATIESAVISGRAAADAIIARAHAN